MYIQALLVLLLWACCWSRSLSIHNETTPPPCEHTYIHRHTHERYGAHFIVGCHAAAPSIKVSRPWWVFWIHILIPSWCTLRLTELSSVSLSSRHHYVYCWFMQLNWKSPEKHLAVVIVWNRTSVGTVCRYCPNKLQRVWMWKINIRIFMRHGKYKMTFT